MKGYSKKRSKISTFKELYSSGGKQRYTEKKLVEYIVCQMVINVIEKNKAGQQAGEVPTLNNHRKQGGHRRPQ